MASPSGPLQTPALATGAARWNAWEPSRGIVFGAGLPPRAGEARRLHGDVELRAPGGRAAKRTASPEAEGAAGARVASKADTENTKDTDTADTDTADADLPPATTLAYKIPADVFRAARTAPADSAASFWSYALYRHETDGSGVKVHYCRSAHTTERVCQQYFADEAVLGFDMEWQASATRWDSARRNVCLVQLASARRIALFHLSLFPAGDALVPPALRRLLEDAGVTKLGVNIRGDATRMHTHLGVAMRGTLELSHLHRLVKYVRAGQPRLVNRRVVALATQVEEHLRLPLFKGPDVRQSDWSQVLRPDQIVYSASDAYAAVQLFAVLERQRELLDPTPPRPAHAELGLPIQTAPDAPAAETEDGMADDDADADADADDADIHSETSDASDASDASAPVVLSPAVADAIAHIRLEEDDADEAATADDTPPKTRARSRARAPKAAAAAAVPRDARILAAEDWVVEYLARGDAVKVRRAQLRAYRLWHEHAALTPAAVAALLRDPPLQTETVQKYVLDALLTEPLPYDRQRLRAELLEPLPAWHLPRYTRLARACGMAGGRVGTVLDSDSGRGT